MFLKNSWYVFSWNYELQDSKPLGKVIIEQPIVVWRNSAGILQAAEDRCPHRHAPLSLGRVNGDNLQCMYHGMTFNEQGECIAMPMMDEPPKCSIKKYPVVEKNDWIWVWTGDVDQADEALIPDGWGISNPDRQMRASSIEYDANYQLVHDNLCDLSHIDFVHETTLKMASGADWAEKPPRIQGKDRAIRFERWFEDAELPSQPGLKVDAWSVYEFIVPGVFILYGARFPAGTAKECNYEEPKGIKPIVENIEQQAVTPITRDRTAYHYATGLVIPGKNMTEAIEKRMDVVISAFEEDREMIEAQQKIWNLTDPSVPKQFLAIDQGPTMMRRLLDRLMKAEADV